jgi:hypothetical protein
MSRRWGGALVVERRRRQGATVKQRGVGAGILAAFVAVPVVSALAIGCSGTTGEDTGRLSEPLLNVDQFLYFRCNSTDWNVSEKSRLQSTSNSGVFQLSINVTASTLSDQCVFTLITSSTPDSWGSAQTNYTDSKPSTALVVPGGDVLVGPQSAQTNFNVKYPAVGKYVATVNWTAKTFTLGPPAADAGSADAGHDAAADATTDAATDATADHSVDAPADGALDAQADARDGQTDAGGDATVDAAPDAGPDAAHDASIDAPPDAASDASPDAAADATIDAAPDASVDAAPDASVDAASDATVDGGAPGPVSVLMRHNDLARTGANLQETVLTTANVSGGGFGHLFSRAVDGQIYAQPLYVSQAIGGRNVVYVATEHNSVYAFDADDPSASNPLWQVNLGPSMPSADTIGACPNISPEIGITSTPVIDPVARTIYVVAKTEVSGVVALTLHALDITSGAERPHSPVALAASVTGNGAGSSGNVLAFDPRVQHNRAALTLANGVVHVPSASHCDKGNYHGWVLSYDATTLAQVSAYVTTPNGTTGGIWMGGEGLSADSDGSLFLTVGNGTPADTDGGTSFGNAVVKVHAGTSGQLATTSWFMPWNTAALDTTDTDLGACSALLIPGTRLLVTGGKEGVIYLLNRDSLGGWQGGSSPPDPQIPQRFAPNGTPSSDNVEIAGGPVYWNGPTGGHLYVWAASSQLQSFAFNGTTFSTAPQTGNVAANAAYPASQLSLSASGAAPGTGILWAVHPNSGTAGTLYAFDATNVASPIWSSDQNAGRDALPSVTKFNPPTIAGGKVYVGTSSSQLAVYGLLGAAPDAGSDASVDSGADASLDAGDAGDAQPTDFTYVYDTYFAGTTLSATPGHCGECHGDPSSPAGNVFLGTNMTDFYNGLVTHGLLDTSNPTASVIGNPATSPLSWFGNGGPMPLDEPQTNPAAAAAVTGWLAAGAPMQ